MSLPTAYYFILGSYGAYQYSVGRAPQEDHSLLPKPIWLLRPSPSGMTPWYLVRTSRGYVLKIKDAPTGQDDGSVVAFLNGNYDEWLLEPVQGELGRFRIRSNNGQYWTVDDRDTENGHRIILQEDGMRHQTFSILRDYQDNAEEEEAQYAKKNRGDERQGRLSYKKEKKFCA